MATYFSFEMSSVGDQNLKYSIHFNLLTTELRDRQIQHLASGRHHSELLGTKDVLELIRNV